LSILPIAQFQQLLVFHPSLTPAINGDDNDMDRSDRDSKTFFKLKIASSSGHYSIITLRQHCGGEA
jgi:hypothetical protein